MDDQFLSSSFLFNIIDEKTTNSISSSFLFNILVEKCPVACAAVVCVL